MSRSFRHSVGRLGGALLLALPAMLFGCSEPLPPERAAYAGHWPGDGLSLLITQEGEVNYRRVNGSRSIRIEAPLKSFEGDHFNVGVGAMSTRFDVSQPPRKVGGQWTMVVDGVTLTRGTR
ncbi:MAG: hypothetical protein V4739_18110 [Pseudomonadota bacterium]